MSVDPFAAARAERLLVFRAYTFLWSEIVDQHTSARHIVTAKPQFRKLVQSFQHRQSHNHKLAFRRTVVPFTAT